MYLRTREVTVRTVRLTPTEAELLVEVVSPCPLPTTEIRGRLMGPTCPYSTTVEVAYPIRMIGRAPGQSQLVGRVIIPEPAWWDPESPFLYHGPVELWAEGRKIEEVRVSCGLRHCQIGRDGLKWNGRSTVLHGVRRATLTEDEMRSLRGAGINLLLVPLSDAITAICAAADRVGMFVVTVAKDASAIARMQRGTNPPSLVRCIVAGSTDWADAVLDDESAIQAN